MFKVAIGRRQNQKFVGRVGWKLFCNTFGLNLASIVAKYSENLCGNTLTRITLTSTKEVISILLNSREAPKRIGLVNVGSSLQDSPVLKKSSSISFPNLERLSLQPKTQCLFVFFSNVNCPKLGALRLVNSPLSASQKPFNCLQRFLKSVGSNLRGLVFDLHGAPSLESLQKSRTTLSKN